MIPTSYLITKEMSTQLTISRAADRAVMTTTLDGAQRQRLQQAGGPAAPVSGGYWTFGMPLDGTLDLQPGV